MWPTLAVALLIAVLFTLPIVWLLGWRRPGAAAEESAVLSGLFLFTLVFLATWALTGWLTPWGPGVSGVPWLLALIAAAFVALIVLVVSASPAYAPPPQSSATQGGTPDLGAAASAGAELGGIEGIGLMFWVLVVLLLVVGIIGNTEAW